MRVFIYFTKFSKGKLYPIVILVNLEVCEDAFECQGYNAVFPSIFKFNDLLLTSRHRGLEQFSNSFKAAQQF